MIDNIKKYIKELQGVDPQSTLEILRVASDLNRDEKNIIYIYLHPKPLLHMELPSIIKAGRGKHIEGFRKEKLEEILILLRAYRTTQYHRYILHLLHSFIQNSRSVYVEDDGPDCQCGLCGKKLHLQKKWTSLCEATPKFGEQYRKEFLAFSSSQSSQRVCINCILQLRALHRLLEGIEGPGYLRP